MTAIMMFLAFLFFLGKMFVKLFITIRDNSAKIWHQSQIVAENSLEYWRTRE
jgi:hypothetical protein